MPTNRFAKIQVQAMTDQPEPNETAARMHADCCGCVRRGDLHRERFEHWVQKIEAQAKREPTLAQERLSQFEAYALPNVAIALDRIEAAKRDGTKAALERAVAIANTEAQSEALARDRAKTYGRALVAECRQGGVEIAERIRERIHSLIEPTPVDQEVK